MISPVKTPFCVNPTCSWHKFMVTESVIGIKHKNTKNPRYDPAVTKYAQTLHQLPTWASDAFVNVYPTAPNAFCRIQVESIVSGVTVTGHLCAVCFSAYHLIVLAPIV